MEKKYRVNALVTLYGPKQQQVQNVKRMMAQTDRVFLCDNSSESSRHLFEEIPEAVYLYWGENRGLSLAFNTVLKDKTYGWDDSDFIIFFDQDTRIPDGHIKKLVSQYRNLKRQNVNPGCLGPVYYNASSGMLEVPGKRMHITKHVWNVKSVITSSMLCEYRNLKRIGFWNEEIFLDMSDWDLCWRFMKQGFVCCMTAVSVIHHTVGEGELRAGPFRIRIGKPFREYYQIRDCLYLFRKDYVPFKFRIRFILMLSVRSPLHILLLDHKRERVRFILRGIKDYRSGVSGTLTDGICREGIK